MARTVARQEGREIRHFTTGVFDLVPLEGDTRQQAPKSNPRYYYRPWKTILGRTVADGGEGFYVQVDHRETVTSVDPAPRRAAPPHLSVWGPPPPAPAHHRPPSH